MNNTPHEDKHHKDKHVQTILFVLLLGASVLYFTCFSFPPKALASPYGLWDQDMTGLFFLFWTGLMIAKILWMLEINREIHIFSRTFCAQTPSHQNLPRRLLDDLGYQSMVKDASRSWVFLNIASLSWFALGGLLVIWGVFVALTPPGHDGLTELRFNIENFLNTQNIQNDAIHFHNITLLLSQNLKILLIGIVFWLGQILSYSDRNSAAVLWISMALFTISLVYYTTHSVFLTEIYYDMGRGNIPLWHGYGGMDMPILQMMQVISPSALSPLHNRLLTNGIPSVVILYSLGGGSFLLFARGLFMGSGKRKYALSGCLILLLMGGCDVFSVQTPGLYGVWLSGWACLSMIWVMFQPQAQKGNRAFLQPPQS